MSGAPAQCAYGNICNKKDLPEGDRKKCKRPGHDKLLDQSAIEAFKAKQAEKRADKDRRGDGAAAGGRRNKGGSPAPQADNKDSHGDGAAAGGRQKRDNTKDRSNDTAAADRRPKKDDSPVPQAPKAPSGQKPTTQNVGSHDIVVDAIAPKDLKKLVDLNRVIEGLVKLGVKSNEDAFVERKATFDSFVVEVKMRNPDAICE